MNQAILRSLLWKEWREVQWKAAALVTIALAVYAASLLVWHHPEMRRYQSDAANTAAPALIVVLALGGVFLGMNVAAGERERGTATLLHGLPVRAPALLSAKLVAGISACLLPLVIVGVLSVIEHLTQRDKLVSPVTLVPRVWPVTAIGVTVSMFLWTVAVGVRRPTQVSAGVAGLAAVVVWAMLLMLGPFAGELYLHYSSGDETIVEVFLEALLLLSPFGYILPITDLTLPRTNWLGTMAVTFGVQTVMWVGLVAWGMYRYGYGEAPERGVNAPAGAATRMVAIPVRLTRWGAVIWFQWRRGGPMAILSAMIVVGLAATMSVVLSTDGGNLNEFQGGLAAIAAIAGTVAAILLGIGVFAIDSQKRLDRFWRSRPMDPALWFWLRFATGAAVLLLALHGPVFMAFSLTGGWLYPVSQGEHAAAIALLMGSPVLDFFLYSAAVALVCLLRQPVYAGILAVAAGVAIWIGGGLITMAWSEHWMSETWWTLIRGFSLIYVVEAFDHGAGAWWAYGQFAVTMLTASAVAAWLGYVAIKRDIQLAGG